MSETDAILMPDWPAPANVHARVTTRQLGGHSQPPFDRCNLGSRCGEAVEIVAANRVALSATLRLPTPPRWLHQVHGITVASIDGSSHNDRGERGGTPVDATTAAPIATPEPQADAAVTRDADCVLAVLTADCLPILFCAADGLEVAVAHAGWRGLCAGVIEATVAAMQMPARNVLAWLGPAIGAASYEVGDEVRAAFIDRDVDAASAFIATRPGHWLCDLSALAHQRLAATGIAATFGGSFDTLADPRFYSYRREPRTGRFASLIWRSDA